MGLYTDEEKEGEGEREREREREGGRQRERERDRERERERGRRKGKKGKGMGVRKNNLFLRISFLSSTLSTSRTVLLITVKHCPLGDTVTHTHTPSAATAGL